MSEVIELELLAVEERRGDIRIDGVVACEFLGTDGHVVPDGAPFSLAVRAEPGAAVGDLVGVLRSWADAARPVVVGPAVADDRPVLVFAGTDTAVVLHLR